MTPRFAFFGTPEFAANVLTALIEKNLPPVLVVCNPDRPVGRKQILTKPPVKLIAESHDVPFFQPEHVRDIEGKLRETKPSFGVVAAYAGIIPQDILSVFPRGVVGVHPSLLPLYRGPSPIQTAILEGRTETGVTLYLMDKEVDHGDIISSVICSISGKETYKSLEEKLSRLAGEHLAEIIPRFAGGEIVPAPQIHREATFTKKFTTENAFIEPEMLEKALEGDEIDAQKADRIIRALNPEPGAWTRMTPSLSKHTKISSQEGKRIKLLEAVIENKCLMLKAFQVEGKKPVMIR